MEATNYSNPARLRAPQIALLCGVALVANLYFAGQTSLVVAYVRILHLTLTAAGWLATIEGGAYACGMFFAAISPSIARPTRPKLVGLFALLALAQIMSAGASSLWTLGLCRTLSGASAGLILSLGTATITGTTNAGRAFALYFGALFLSGVVAIPLITGLLQVIGLSGTYLFYAAIIVAALVAVRWYPFRAMQVDEVARAEVTEAARAKAPLALLLAGLFVNFVFNGGIWVLAEQLGLEIPGTDPVWLSTFLAASMLFGLIGTAAAAAIAPRRRNLTSLIVGNALLIVAVLMLSGWRSITGFVLAMALLNVAVTFLTPAALSALSSMERQGAQWGNLATQLGYSVGPVLIAGLESRFGISGLVFTSVGGLLLSVALSCGALWPRSADDTLNAQPHNSTE
jgi:predicted MFS family arabinose efflux permease